MLRRIDQFQLASTVEIPSQFDELAEISTDLLRQAHTQGLDRDLAAVRTTADVQARRLFIESQHEHPADREGLAIHLGHHGAWLMVSFQQAITPEQRSELSYPRSTLVLEQSGTHVHHTDFVHIGPSQHLEHNEIAGQYFTDRLYRSLGYFGIYSQSELEQHQRAS